MNKSALLIAAAAIGFLFVFVTAYSQEDMQFVDNSVFDNPQREPSVFKHDEHNEIAEIEECNECHHIYEYGVKLEDQSSEDQMCSECHLQGSSEGQPSRTKALHTNCKGCHLIEKKGPIMCGECHVKG